MRALTFAVTMALLVLPARASASDPAPEPPLRWDEDRPRFRTTEYVLTILTGVEAIAMYYKVPPTREPHWTGGILFDDAVRNALRVKSRSGLRIVWDAADVLGSAEVWITVGVDSFLVPLLRGSPDVAWQVTWMDLESYALDSIVTFALYDSVGRARPNYEDCQRDPSLYDNCSTSPTASFPSGHTSEAFMSAGLSCANHAYLPIYGSRLLDGLACARDVTLATVDGLLRIMGDRHYATDVIAGAGLGFAFGYGVPVFLHYTARTSRPPIAIAPLVGHRIGLGVTGFF
jgi:membrane-associated phospholipid phosphatase